MTSHFPIILHHFEKSPFSEKVRVVFGLKKMAWASVLIPRIMPRPDLMPMTGGYRRTPTMQIGADIYCDSQMIIRELEQRFPEPTLFPDANAGLPWCLGLLQQRFGIADFELSWLIEVESLDHAVDHQHRIALRTHAHAFLDKVNLQAERLGVLPAANG